MATLNIGIKIAYTNAMNQSLVAGVNESVVIYTVGTNEYAEADVIGVSSGIGTSNAAYLWLGTADVNHQARGFCTPTTLNVMEAGQVVSNSVVVTPGLINTKTYLAAGQKIGYRRTLGFGINYTVTVRAFVNTL